MSECKAIKAVSISCILGDKRLKLRIKIRENVFWLRKGGLKNRDLNLGIEGMEKILNFGNIKVKCKLHAKKRVCIINNG